MKLFFLHSVQKRPVRGYWNLS